MLILKRTFAAYYFMLTSFRNFQRKIGLKFLLDRNQDNGAVALLSAGEFLLLGLATAIAKSQLGFKFTAAMGYLYLLIFASLMIIQYIYFLRNRDRRRDSIERFRDLTKEAKFFWSFFAILILVLPIILFPILLK